MCTDYGCTVDVRVGPCLFRVGLGYLPYQKRTASDYHRSELGLARQGGVRVVAYGGRAGGRGNLRNRNPATPPDSKPCTNKTPTSERERATERARTNESFLLTCFFLD